MIRIDENDPEYISHLEKFSKPYDELIETIYRYHPNLNRELLDKAYKFGIWAHRDQIRDSGEPYFEHCLNVAKILSELKMDSTTIAAGLLHDVVEDTVFTLQDIEEIFNRDIANLVNGVTKITEISGRKSSSFEVRQAETYRKMLLSMTNDIRVIIIKFADRLHNMRTLQHIPAPNRRLRIALETRDVYAPLAHRFGMARLKSELEDLAFKFIDNKAYTELARSLNEKREERENYIQNIIKPIKKELEEHGIKAEVQGRPKHLYSIYKKMKTRNKPLEEIYDLFAIRIIVEDVAQCYYVLGIVHNLFIPVYERFKDYIAMPKFNGYQSLHTTVVDKSGRMLEIQIRTWEMHRIAEMGIAAHWRYKEGKNLEKNDDIDNKLVWVRQLLEQYDGETVDAKDFLDSLKINLYQDEVFVFTPKGDVIKLPKGSTPVDFAFAVHTSIGMHCIGAKVNGKIVPLKYQLNSGDQVEIITSQNQHPNQDWLTFVKTAKARHRIRKYLREVQFEHSVKLGDEILQKYSKRYHLKVSDEKLEEIANNLHYDDAKQLRAAIGRGEISIEKIFSFLTDEKLKEPKYNLFTKILKRGRKHSAIQVDGVDNMVVHIGKCCQPVPGDEIIGYISRGKGITIHRTNCPNISRLIEKKDRTIPVNWNVEAEEQFKVQLAILGEDRKNFLRDITQAISVHNTNILHIDFTSKDKLVVGKLVIEVKNLPHLTRIIQSISKVNGMLSVERVEGFSKKRR